MPQHYISRKELKRDEFRDGIVHGAEAVATHQKTAWTVGSIVLLIALGIFGWRFYTQRQTVKAEASLGDALKTYEAPIATPSEPATPGELTYGDEKTRDTDAERKFADVAARYPRTHPGEVARYYDALCLEALGSNDQAEKNLKAVAGGSDPDFAALARFQLAQFYDKNGRGPEAVALYQLLEDKPSVLVPKAMVLLSLADHYAQSDPAQAAKLYNQIKTDYSGTPVADQADERLELLNTKS
ncbi:MAG: tetratricopeptide repeat protein [Candidatus Acidiferrales bacterium]